LRPRSLRRFGGAALALFFVAASSCGGEGNTGRWVPDPSLVRAVPWLNGVLPAVDPGNAAILPGSPVYPPIGLGLADPGSLSTDCGALQGLEFSAGWFDTFESAMPDDPTYYGVASGWASYDDLTKYSWHAPGDATWYPDLNPGTTKKFLALWGLPAEKVPGPSCNGVPNDWALHFRGGLFRKWGAGISHALTDPVGRYRLSPTETCPADVDFCPPPIAATATVDTAGLPVKGRSGADYLNSHDFVDVSGYEGVAFWARRGPEGQDRVLVIFTDKFTSSRLAFENETFCRRVRECHTKCLNDMPCSPDSPGSSNAVYRCFDPSKGPLPTVPLAIDSLIDLMYPRCGPSACTSPSTYRDSDFDGKACRPYTFPAADEYGEYCWNENDPPPPSRDDRCQDGWQKVVQLSPDWRFYALPFSEFGQGGFGKRAPYMDLKSIDVIGFGSTMGLADIYIDNVTFYRHKK
jgi:hypothetical protein